MSLRTIPASRVRAERMRWLWTDRVPLGSLTILAGDGGLGKSTLTVALAAKLSRGELDGDLRGTPAPTLILSTEDDAATTVKPRLMAAQADLKQVSFQAEDSDGAYAPMTLPEQHDELAAEVDRLGVRLLVLDPLTAFLSERVDAYKDHSVRRVLGPVAAFARHQQIAVVGIMHLNRREGGDTSSRISGSSAFRNAARSVLIFGADPQDPAGRDGAHRVVAQEKANLSRPGLRSVACCIESALVDSDDGDRIETSRIVLVGESDATASDVLAPRRQDDEEDDRSEAEMFLLAALADGPRPAREVVAEARPLRITTTMLKTARKKLGIKSRQRVGYWEWFPPQATPDAHVPSGSSGSPGSSGSSGSSDPQETQETPPVDGPLPLDDRTASDLAPPEDWGPALDPAELDAREREYEALRPEHPDD